MRFEFTMADLSEARKQPVEIEAKRTPEMPAVEASLVFHPISDKFAVYFSAADVVERERSFPESSRIPGITYLVPGQPDADGWIRTSEKLPDMGERAIVSSAAGVMMIDWREYVSADTWLWKHAPSGSSWTCWQPLPKPPKKPELTANELREKGRAMIRDVIKRVPGPLARELEDALVYYRAANDCA